MSILIFGPPGAGKGTQSARVSLKMGYSHISTGDLFRAAIKIESPLGSEVKGYLDKGALVPDLLTLKVLEKAIKVSPGKPFILDGFPRTIPQANSLDVLLVEMGLKLAAAVFLEVGESELVERLSGRRTCEKCQELYHLRAKPPLKMGTCDKCGGKLIQRTDDKPEVIRNRLATYNKSTAPLKEFYSGKGLLRVVNGDQNEDTVFEEVIAIIQAV